MLGDYTDGPKMRNNENKLLKLTNSSTKNASRSRKEF